jgi:hypothetical protein
MSHDDHGKAMEKIEEDEVPSFALYMSAVVRK